MPQTEKEQLSKEEKAKRLREIQLPMERRLIKHPDFEIAYPEKVTWVGFLIVVGICLGLLGLVKLLSTIGS